MLKPEMKRGLHMSRVLKKLETGSDQFLGMIGFVGILVITANAFYGYPWHGLMSFCAQL